MSAWIYSTSRFFAWIGGFLLSMIAIMSVVSIIGRALSTLGFRPLPGDFELVQVGTAIVVFCFLPWCHLKKGHADVTLFSPFIPKAMKQVINVFIELTTFIVWLLLIWRMGVATLEYQHNKEVSFILQMPVWWGYALSMLPCAFGCVVYGLRLLESLNIVPVPKDFITTEGTHQ